MNIKHILILVAIVMILFTLCGCSDNDDISTAEPGVNTEEIQIDENDPQDEEVIDEYYIATSGNDLNSGTINEPWKTFSRAVGQVNPGDTVYVMEGVYNDRLIINKSGMHESFITFMAYPGDSVTIDGEGIDMPEWAGLIHILRQQYIRISGFNIINSPAMGVFACSSNHITINNNYIYNTFAPGILTWEDSNLIIDGNKLEKTCIEENAPLECLSTRNIDHFQISNNHVFESGAIGIDVADSFSDGKVFDNEVHDVGLGIYLDSWEGYGTDTEVFDNICYSNEFGFCVNSENGGLVENVKLYNNAAYNNSANGFTLCWGGVFDASHSVKKIDIFANRSYDNGDNGLCIFGIRDGLVEDIRIVNNLFYNNKGSGVTIDGVAKEPFAYVIRNIRIVNNTIFNNGSDDVWGSGGIYIGNPITETGIMEDITIQNNIISNNKLFTIAIWPWGTAPSNVIINHNFFENFLGNTNDFGETRGDDYFEGSPSFVDGTTGNFHLSSDSPAIDIASAAGAPSDDFELNVRRSRLWWRSSLQ